MYIWTLGLGDEQSVSPQLVDRSAGILSEGELDRANRFYRSRDRNRFCLAHALCRLMLSHFETTYRPEQWCFATESKGRPYISGDFDLSSKIDFNLSHTNGMVGCAIGFNCRVGLDLEDKNRKADIDNLARKQFADMEQKQFFQSVGQNRQQRFFQFWTLKEAYIKVTGRGLSEPLAGFGFDLAQSEPELHKNGRLQNQYQFGLFDGGASHQGAWAVESSGRTGEPEISQLDLKDFEALLA